MGWCDNKDAVVAFVYLIVILRFARLFIVSQSRRLSKCNHHLVTIIYLALKL